MSNDPIATPRDPDHASGLVAVLRDRAPKLALALAAGQAAWPVASWARAKVRERRMFTVKIPGTDEVYDDVHEWVLGLLPPQDRRALIAHSASGRADADAPMTVDDQRRAPAPVLRLRYDGSRVQPVRVRGHRVQVSVFDSAGQPDGKDNGYFKPPEIMFQAGTVEGRQAVLDEVAAILARSRAAERSPAFRMLGAYGWERLDDLPGRPLDSVILAAGQMERLTADISRFLEAEREYVRRGLPWHRGYLLSGPPGTGKTSVARALAGHFGMDLWYLPLSDVKKDGELLRLASRVTPRSMLLLEDADVFHAATSRDDDADVTLSGLLNALDGIATPHGLLTVLTSNDPGALDPALVRPGRVDLIEDFGNAKPEQVARLASHYYGVPVDEADAFGIPETAPAAVIEACKRHDDPGGALAGLRAGTALASAA